MFVHDKGLVWERTPKNNANQHLVRDRQAIPGPVLETGAVPTRPPVRKVPVPKTEGGRPRPPARPARKVPVLETGAVPPRPPARPVRKVPVPKAEGGPPRRPARKEPAAAGRPGSR
jgi:hypothetical protein